MARFTAGLLFTVLLVGLVFVATLGTLESVLAVAAALAISVALAGMTRFNTDDLGTGLVYAGMLTSPMFSGIFHPSHFTVSNIFFGAGFAVLLPRLLRSRMRLPVTWALGLVILTCAGLASTPTSAYPTTGVLRMVSFLITVVALPAMLMWWHPPKPIVVRLAIAYIIGQSISTAVGFLHGEAAHNRLEGLTTHPNAFGMLGVFAVGLLLFVGPEIGRSRRRLIWLGLAVNGAGVVLSGSRAALVALAVVILVVPFVERSARVVYLYAVAGAALLMTAPVVLASLGPNSAPNRLLHPSQSTSGASGSIDQREALLSRGWHDFQQHPILGSGFGGTYTFFYHNVCLEFMVAAGLVGLVGWLMVLYTMVRPLFTDHPMHRTAYCAVAFLVTSMFSPTVTEGWIWSVLAFPLLAAATTATHARPDPATTLAPRKDPAWNA